MRFRGVGATPAWIKRGHNFGVGEQKKRDPNGWQQGIVGEGAANPAPPATVSGERCRLPQRGPGGDPAAESYSCTLCHQIASPDISVYSCSCVLSCLCLFDCNTFSWYSVYSSVGAPYVLAWHGPWGNVPTPPMR